MSRIKSVTEPCNKGKLQGKQASRAEFLPRGSRINLLLVLSASLAVTFNSTLAVASPPAIEVRDGSRNVANVDGFVSLASVVVGQTGVTKTITIVNNTNTAAVLQAASFTSGAGFSIVNFSANQQLAAGATATIVLRLDSATTGYKTATLRFVTSLTTFPAFSFRVYGAVTNGGIVIDDADIGFSSTGIWTSAPGYGGDCKRAVGSGQNATATATWMFTGLAPGKYNVDISYFGNSGLTGNAQYVIRDGGANGAIVARPGVNQQYQPFSIDPIVGGQPFGRLATVTITTHTLVIQTSNAGFPSNYNIVADAMQVVPTR